MTGSTVPFEKFCPINRFNCFFLFGIKIENDRSNSCNYYEEENVFTAFSHREYSEYRKQLL